MRVLLRSDIASHQGLPKEYDLDLSNHQSADGTAQPAKNTFVFSEQDLPGFRARNKARTAAAAAGIPAYLLRQKDRVEKPGDNQTGGRPWGRRNRQEYFRKAIPSSFRPNAGACATADYPYRKHRHLRTYRTGDELRTG